jgi:WD40 repeat protein
VIARHTNPVYAVSFSPKGQFFVTGAFDQVLYIWRVADAALVAEYRAPGGIFEAVWNPTGASIAVCLADSEVAVIPTNIIPLYHE